MQNEKIVVKNIKIGELKISEENVRKDLNYNKGDTTIEELKENIKEKGLINPITVIKDETGKYEVIAGKRRVMACKRLGWKTIPVHIIQISEEIEKVSISLTENLHRVDLNPIDKAKSFKKLYEHYGSVSKVAEKLGVAASTIWRYLKLLGLNQEIQAKIEKEGLEIGLKAMGKIADVFSEEYHQKVINLMDDFTQKEQIEMIEECQGDFARLKSIKMRKLTQEIIEKVLPYRMRDITRQVEEKYRELIEISPLIEPIFKQLLNNRPKYHEYDIRREKISPLRAFYDVKGFFEHNRDYNHHPEKFLSLLLQDFIQFHSRYPAGKGIKKKIFSMVLELLSLIENIGKDSIYFQVLNKINTIRFEEKEEILQEYIHCLTKSEIDVNIRVLLFQILEKDHFKDRIEEFLSLLQADILKTPLELKMSILNRLNEENPKYSSILSNSNEVLISLYQGEVENTIKEKIRDILTKQGKVCGICGTIINQEKKLSEIQFCEICNKTYCKACFEEEKPFTHCDFCDAYFCKEHNDYYDLINIEGRNISLCDICLEEGKYKNEQKMCKSCQKNIKTCEGETCERTICMDHLKHCDLCKKSFCPNCAETILGGSVFGPTCLDCLENRIVHCEICEHEMDREYNAQQCHDCGKILCEEHAHFSPRTTFYYCEECQESWKDYAWTMYNEGH